MSKPNYIVRFPDGQYNCCDGLGEAFDRRKGEGTVYERLGHSTGRKIDVDDALLEACKASMRLLESTTFDDPADLAAIEAIQSAIRAAEKFRAEMARAMEQGT